MKPIATAADFRKLADAIYALRARIYAASKEMETRP